MADNKFSLPVVAGTLQTDPRSGGIKRSSGVNVLPCVGKTWSQVRDDKNDDVNWLIAGYVSNSKTDVAVIAKGRGGMDICSQSLPNNQAVFGGIRVGQRFVTFFYADEETPTMQKGRASMHKNGVLNVLEGADGEVEMKRAKSVDYNPLDQHNIREIDDKASTQNVAKEKKNASGTRIGSCPLDEMGPTTPKAEGVPLSKIQNVESSQLPPGVDPARRELALSDKEFEEVFGMNLEAFNGLAAWKRNNLKKKHGLF